MREPEVILNPGEHVRRVGARFDGDIQRVREAHVIDPGPAYGQARSFDRHNPRHLLMLFGAMSAASVLMILLLAGIGVNRIYSGEKIRDAEHDAIAVGQAIFEQERHVLTTRMSDGRERIQIEPDGLAGLDERMRRVLRLFNIYKIKLFSHDKTIVYSTDQSIIGKVDSDNARLERVLRLAQADSKLQAKDHVADLFGETRFDVDVVETYLPIKDDDGKAIGSFEIYSDVTAARERSAEVLRSSLSVLLSVLAVVFGGLFLVMWKGTSWLEEAQSRLQSLAATDLLTGMFNRRHLMSRIHEEFSRMSRQRRDVVKPYLSFVMVDIDHFKAINDTHGHVAGDEIICQVAARLRECLRAHDVIGRYGGEEFLATLPNTDLDEAREIAERLHRAVGAAPYEVLGAIINVTVSAGVSQAEVGEKSVVAAIRRADDNLYRAKGLGRDRVCA